MKSLFAILMAPLLASAHFVFVVPQKDGTVKVVFSEDLETDEAVTVEKLAALKLTTLTDGQAGEIKLTAAKHEMIGKPEAKATVAFGAVPYGVMSRAGSKPFLLNYIPKAIWGQPDSKAVTLGNKVPVEIVPAYKDGKTVLCVLADGKPVKGGEINLINGDGKRSKAKTDAKGLTEPLALIGQYGAWLRYTETKAGTLGTEKYDEIRHYPTLVATVPAKEKP